MPIDDIKEFEIQVNNPTTSRLQKFGWYLHLFDNYDGYNGPLATYLAEHFDLISLSSSQWKAAQYIKSLNPDIKILRYYDVSWISYQYSGDMPYVNAHPNCLVHHIHTGNRIRAVEYPANYLLNPDPNKDWAPYFVQSCVNFLNSSNGQYFDGICTDDAMTYPNYNLIDDVTGEALDKTTDLEDSVWQNWNENIRGMANWGVQIHAALQNALTANDPARNLILPNSWFYTDICEYATNTHMLENFIHGDQHDIESMGFTYVRGDYTANAKTNLQIIQIHNQAKLGKTVVVHPGTRGCTEHDQTTCSTAHTYCQWQTFHTGAGRCLIKLDSLEQERWVNFTLGCFLLSIEDITKSYFSFGHIWDYCRNWGWWPIMDTEFGQPVSNKNWTDIQQMRLGNTDVYAREFQNYYVAVNLHTSITYNNVLINGTYYNFPARTAIFIKKGA